MGSKIRIQKRGHLQLMPAQAVKINFHENGFRNTENHENVNTGLSLHL